MDEKHPIESKPGIPQGLLKNVLNALLVTLLGFLLLNLTFILYAGVYNLFMRGAKMVTGEGVEFYRTAPPYLLRIGLMLAIVILSWFVLRSRLHLIIRAAFLMVPLATVLVTIGMHLYSMPVLVYTIGGVICAGTILWFFKKRWHWLFSYSVIFVASALTLMNIFGIDI